MSRNGSAYHKLLNSRRWKELRRKQLDTAPFCCRCALDGLIVPASDVHHKKPVESGLTPVGMELLAFDPGNLMSLCRDCHIKIHKEMGSHKNVKARTEARAKAEAEAFWERFGE